VLGWWKRRGEKLRANTRRSDPRERVQRDEYRHAGPDEIVVTGGVAMSGPGGARQPDLDER